MQQPQQHHKPKLFEGLRTGDLRDMVSPLISFDQFKSKMGEDKDVVVISFKVKEKLPAIDLMEFIEKGYKFVLDADTSTGEERDGQYSVFVEIERNENIPHYVLEMLDGVKQLCDCDSWQFRYFRDPNVYDLTEQVLAEHVPLDKLAYEVKMQGMKQGAVQEFFDQGAIDSVSVDTENNLTISKPYVESLNLKLLAIGEYETLKDRLKGGIQLDESSRNQTVFLEKYLGNYEIYKISDKFLIKNKDKAIIVDKDAW